MLTLDFNFITFLKADNSLENVRFSPILMTKLRAWVEVITDAGCALFAQQWHVIWLAEFSSEFAVFIGLVSCLSVLRNAQLKAAKECSAM